MTRCVNVLHEAHCTILDGTLNLIIEKLSSQHSQMKGQSLLSASYDDKLGWSRGMESGHVRVPVMSLSLSHHSSFSSQGGSLLRGKPSKDVSRSELYERFKTIVVKSVEFFTYSGGLTFWSKISIPSTFLSVCFKVLKLSCFLLYRLLLLVIFLEPRDDSPISSEVEQTFARRLFSTLLEGLCSVVDRRSVDSKSLWNGAMWAARDTLRYVDIKKSLFLH